MSENGLPISEMHIPRPHRIFSVLLSAWLLFPFTVVVFLLILGLQQARHEFEEHAQQIYDDVSSRMQDNRAALVSFTAFLGVTQRGQRDEIGHYASYVLRDNPHLYALEIVEEVPAARVASFLKEMRSSATPGFTLRELDDSGEHQWRPAQSRDIYYPLTIMALADGPSDLLLGMDIGQVPIFRELLAAASRDSGPGASPPFPLYEGGDGFALMTRVDPHAAKAERQGERRFAVAIVRVGDLLPDASLPQEYNFDIHILARLQGDREPVMLLHRPAAVGSRLMKMVLPVLHFERHLQESVPPLTITIVRQVTWRDINLPLIALVIVVASITFTLLQAYARAHRRSEQRRMELEELLHYRAYHDDLTGLPNRTLIIDRIEQGVRNAQRDHQSLAVLFLDLDGFKPINDTYGHKAGDEILRGVAQRLRTIVRERDTVGRLSGDEFIMVLTDTDREGSSVVCEKIKSVFEAPFDVGAGIPLSIGISVGVAIYPDEGTTTLELMRIADRDMYRHKPAH